MATAQGRDSLVECLVQRGPGRLILGTQNFFLIVPGGFQIGKLGHHVGLLAVGECIKRRLSQHLELLRFRSGVNGP